ncbi:SRPBCC domain-containing protein [Roseibium litorale]|uniref:SRPBCC domain-containing protein n=1 Tax=Roseibium litorale TaxID=2803841 RepID=A0ABR9CR47_9HYPH|nr:SRPBCC domain-containing protein [Roseibium litorale]MBD8893129.1 SRPBCC domain-containing protein [Roseibium litorale]
MPADDTCHFERFLKLPRDKAFALLVDTLSEWWGPVSGNAHLQDAALEPHPGGVCYENTAENGHLVWGTVLSIARPLYIRLAWQVTSDGQAIRDSAAASRVMIALREAAGGTRLELTHSDFIRHGEDAASSFEAASGGNGWPARLDRLQAAALKTRS